MTEAIHPCLKCGVCCTNYRVEFSIYELQSMGGTVPDELAHEVPGKGNRARMNGTAQHPVRCVALGIWATTALAARFTNNARAPAVISRLPPMAATTPAPNLTCPH